MCGRAACTLSPASACEAAGLPATAFHDPAGHYAPSPNIAPGGYLPAVLTDAVTGQRVVQPVKWGLVPSFTPANATKLDHFRMFNARSETCGTLPSFRALVNKRRAVCLVDGYYEWIADALGEKQPFFVRRTDGHPLKLAAIYDAWQSSRTGEEPLLTLAILTTAASPALAWLHDRLPVVLSDADALAWEDPSLSLQTLLDDRGTRLLQTPLFTPCGGAAERGEGLQRVPAEQSVPHPAHAHYPNPVEAAAAASESAFATSSGSYDTAGPTAAPERGPHAGANQISYAEVSSALISYAADASAAAAAADTSSAPASSTAAAPTAIGGTFLTWRPVDKRVNKLAYNGGDATTAPIALAAHMLAGKAGGVSKGLAAAAASHRGPTLLQLFGRSSPPRPTAASSATAAAASTGSPPSRRSAQSTPSRASPSKSPSSAAGCAGGGSGGAKRKRGGEWAASGDRDVDEQDDDLLVEEGGAKRSPLPATTARASSSIAAFLSRGGGGGGGSSVKKAK